MWWFLIISVMRYQWYHTYSYRAINIFSDISDDNWFLWLYLWWDTSDEITVISVMRYQWYLWWDTSDICDEIPVIFVMRYPWWDISDICDEIPVISVMRYQWYQVYNGGADLSVADRAGILMTKVKNMMKKKTAIKRGSMSQELSHFPVIAM